MREAGGLKEVREVERMKEERERNRESKEDGGNLGMEVE